MSHWRLYILLAFGLRHCQLVSKARLNATLDGDALNRALFCHLGMGPESLLFQPQMASIRRAIKTGALIVSQKPCHKHRPEQQ